MINLHLDFVWTLGCNRFKKFCRKHEWDQLNLTCMNIILVGAKVHDLIVVDANWLWTWATQQSFTTLWYYCYNNCTCIITNPLLLKSFFSTPLFINYRCPKFDSQDFNSFYSNLDSEYIQAIVKSHMMNHKLSPIGSVWKSHSQPFFEGHCKLYLQHLYKCKLNF